MKAILIIALAFGIQISTLIASNMGDVVTPTEPSSLFCPECPILAPTVPMEAPFSETAEFDSPMDLAPAIPMEATFDNDFEVELAANSFAPDLPLQADFDDVVSPIELDIGFAPVVPITADFSDTL
ncbi:MAG: hypothetical protein HQ542_06145 [Bacteroidia bacterium]|nr:hypothetical protein [Bacteroidia bacterium]